MRDGRHRSRDNESQDVNVRRLAPDVLDLIDEVAGGQGFIVDRPGVINVTHLESVGVSLQGWNLFTAAEQAIDGPSLYSSDDPDGTFRPELPRRWFPVPGGSLLQFVWRGRWQDELDGNGVAVDPVSALRLLRRDGPDGTPEIADEFPLVGRRAVVPSSRPYRGGVEFAFELVGSGEHECEVRPVITALGTSGQQMPVAADPEFGEVETWRTDGSSADGEVSFALPSGAEAGHVHVVAVSGFGTDIGSFAVSGYTTLHNQSISMGFSRTGRGRLMWKLLTQADVDAGSITVSAGGTTQWRCSQFCVSGDSVEAHETVFTKDQAASWTATVEGSTLALSHTQGASLVGMHGGNVRVGADGEMFADVVGSADDSVWLRGWTVDGSVAMTRETSVSNDFLWLRTLLSFAKAV